VTASFFKTLDSVLPPYLGASVWAVGFSGGSDSTALLHLLGQWQRRRSMQSDPNETLPLLQAIHVNHALNAHSSEWQAHCQSNCDDWDVAFTSLEVTVASQASIEAAARDARYRAFEAALPPGAVLFLAHHLDDQVETFFQRLMRGAGVDGLAAIPTSRSLGEATIVRPLLDHTREELSQYVSTQGLSFIEDPSNTDVAIDRNFLRLRVMPLLETRWPAYRRTVARAAQHMASSSDALREHFGLPGTLFNDLGDPGLRLAPLQCDGGAARLRLWLMEQGLQVPDADALDEFIRQLCAAGSESAAKLSLRDYQLARYGDAVYRLPDLDASVRPSYEIAPGQSLIIPGVGSVALEQNKLGSVGPPIPGTLLKIIDEKGNELAPGEIGEIVGRSGNMSNGYHNRDEATNEMHWFDRDNQLFYRSGDVGYLDEDGWLFLSDRRKDMIISGGFNIYATDLELVLLEHPDVHEVAVVALSSSEWGETPLALVVPEDTVSTDETALLGWANERLGKLQRISQLVFCEELPKSSIGKVLKRELRETYAHLAQ